MRPIDYVIFSSFGNDSIALIQTLNEREDIPNDSVLVVYSETHWSTGVWSERVEKAADWLAFIGMRFQRIDSEGMVALVKRKKAWPRNGIQFCTEELKIRPARFGPRSPW